MTFAKFLYHSFFLAFPRRRGPAGVLLPILAAALVAAAGCASLGGKAPSPDDSLPGDATSAAAAPATAVLDTFATAVPDTLPARELPRGPDGSVPLDEMELLASGAMALAAEGRFDAAQDNLFLLQDATEEPLPADADSQYVAHRRSLQRRVTLLSAVLAEQGAFSGHPDDADSLLTDGYARLAQVDFPDSLVPATGGTLSPITADLLKVDNQAVNRWVNHFTGRGRASFQTWLDRRVQADSLVTAVLGEFGLPRELIYLGVIESGLSPRAVSNVGAVGPWQFMAGTAKDYGLRRNWWLDERRDLEMSTRAAARYIADLYDQFGDWALVLAAYNTGGGRVERKIRQHGHDNFWNLRLPSQTTAHIPKYIAAARIGENPERYGFEVRDLPALAYDVVPVDDATDLELIAGCAGVSGDAVRRLNPALLRGATPPDLKGYPVRVPAGSGPKAVAALRRVPADQRLTWRRHRVERGETLGHIARTYGASVGDIARLNKLADVNRIRPGDQLLIPMPAELADKARARAAEKGHYVPPDGYVRVAYKVRSGDTLGGIARKLGVSLAHLRKVNNIHQTSLIRPGQQLYAYRPGG
jgi:LysM repeat protein